MKVNLETVGKFIHCYKSKTNKITRIAINALMILNNCLITTLFFTSSNMITGVVLSISIIGSAVIIEKFYK